MRNSWLKSTSTPNTSNADTQSGYAKNALLNTDTQFTTPVEASRPTWGGNEWLPHCAPNQ